MCIRDSYKYSGTLQADYQVTKTGDKGMPDYTVAKDFKVVWNHRQDAKASPNKMCIRDRSENSRTGFWGKGAIEQISSLLQKELPGLRGFSATCLLYTSRCV